jgi:4,5-dihydroxyphthalate decarboxylase
MAKLRLSVAAGDYDIVRPLIEGAVQAEGLELVFLTDMGPRERHWRMGRKHEFDVCEENVGAYYMIRDQGEPISAIPVFLHRRFRHGFVFVNAKDGIKEPKDLNGQVIGGTNYQPASNIWMRGILDEHYGFKHRSCTWLVDREEDVHFDVPKDLRIEKKTSSKTLGEMLADGDIKAMISPTLPKPFVQGDTRIQRLFQDYKQVEVDYFKSTGIFPIMHVTTIKQEIVDKYPWVATNLVKAFEASKQLAYKRLANPRMVPLAFVRTAVEEQEKIFGKDPWSYGLTPQNRKTLDTVQRYAHQQGMIKSTRPLDSSRAIEANREGAIGPANRTRTHSFWLNEPPCSARHETTIKNPRSKYFSLERVAPLLVLDLKHPQVRVALDLALDIGARVRFGEQGALLRRQPGDAAVHVAGLGQHLEGAVEQVELHDDGTAPLVALTEHGGKQAFGIAAAQVSLHPQFGGEAPIRGQA